MKDTIVEIQVFYEIAMAIGTDLDLRKMLKTSLITSLKKLICSSGAVLRQVRGTDDNWQYEGVCAIPRNLEASQTYCQVMQAIPAAMDAGTLEAFTESLPLTGTTPDHQYFYIMPLPGFGLLILIKKNRPLETRILKSLAQVNIKLAEACRACIQNDEIRRMNRNLSQEIRRRQKAEEAKARFLANMSHELITPMNGVVTAAQLMEETALTPEQGHLVQTQRKSADHLMHLLSGLLDFSLAGAEHFGTGPEGFSLAALAAEVAGRHEPAALKKGLQVKVEVAADLPAMVTGHPKPLTSALEELVGNAVKFTDQGGVWLRLRQGRDPGFALEISVSDTGIGIDKKDQEHLFDSFYQADDSDGKRYCGTGLGLARVNQQVLGMGGWIRIESTPGKGTEVKLGLPVSWRTPATEKAVESSAFKGARILVVDDNPVNLMLLATLCRNMGGRADTAATGQAAVDMVGRRRYDLVLMDCQMPGMDGYAATALIRSGGSGIKTPEVPVVAVTAHISEENQEKCRAAGMNGFIPKPVTREKIAAAVFPLIPGDLLG